MSEYKEREDEMGAVKPLDNARSLDRWEVWIAESADSMHVRSVTVLAVSEVSAYRIARETYREYVIRAVMSA